MGNRGWGAGARQSIAWVLVVVFAAVSVAAVVTGFVRYRLLDTDHYVAATNSLATDPAIQHYVITTTTNAIASQSNLDGIIARALQSASGVVPGALQPRAGSAADSMARWTSDRAMSAIHDAVTAVVKSPQFRSGWEALNRQMHPHLVDMLTGSHDYVQLDNDGIVSLQLGPLVAAVKDRLASESVPFAKDIPAVNLQIEVIHAPALRAAQDIVQPIVRAAPVLPWVAVALAALAIVIAVTGRRMRMLAAVGWSLAIAMALAAVALAYCRYWYLRQMPADVMPRDAASAVFDTLIDPLWPVLGVVAAGGLIIALLAHIGARAAMRRPAGLRAASVGSGAAAVPDGPAVDEGSVNSLLAEDDSDPSAGSQPERS